MGKPIVVIKSKEAIEISAPESRVPRDDAEDIEETEETEDEINSGSHRDALKTCKKFAGNPVLSTRDSDREPSQLPYKPAVNSSKCGGGG